MGSWKVQLVLVLSLDLLLITTLLAKTSAVKDHGHTNIVEESLIKYLPGFNGSLPFEMHTGYINVNDSTSNELFYYFVKSERNASEDPLILWLTGGPGCSVFIALAYEIGPLRFVWKAYDGITLPELRLNPYSYTKYASILFVDSPSGSGFSNSEYPKEDYITGDHKTLREAYTFLIKWFKKHPEFLSNPFYIAGDSYSGIIVPMLALRVVNGNEEGVEPIVNFKGYMLGNPVTDREYDTSQVPFARSMGLISEELYEATSLSCKGKYYATNNSEECAKNVAKVKMLLEGIFPPQVLENDCGYLWSPRPRNIAHDRVLYDSLATEYLTLDHTLIPPIDCRIYTYYLGYILMNNDTVRTALNVKENTSSWEWIRCVNGTRIDYKEEIYSVLGYHVALLNKGYPALIYSGDHDSIIPHIGTESWIRSLNLNIVDDWRPWYVGDQVAGYTRKFSQNLTYATVKGGGHTAPEFKPRECQAMFSRWISGTPI